jgi:hypothetical protein
MDQEDFEIMLLRQQLETRIFLWDVLEYQERLATAIEFLAEKAGCEFSVTGEGVEA